MNINFTKELQMHELTDGRARDARQAEATHAGVETFEGRIDRAREQKPLLDFNVKTIEYRLTAGPA
ncbi:hypothetical protein DYH55_22715 [Methylovirgula sp. 4M-Z18]|nr:hypothetical protein DYH55_22715 [Methylovirgula sp. 4M-Z18]